MNISKIVATLAVGLLLPIAAHAATNPCPTPNGGSADNEGLDPTYLADIPTDGSCNVLITFSSGGAIATSHPNPVGYYDAGADDNMVGIINNSGATISSIYLTSGTDIFGFDADGICGGYTFSSGTCGTAEVNLGLSDPSDDYLPQGVTVTGIGVGCGGSNDCGTVNFASGIANGGTAFFSLEDSVSLTAQGVTNASAPEPNSLMLLGTGVLGMAGMLRRRFVK